MHCILSCLPVMQSPYWCLPAGHVVAPQWLDRHSTASTATTISQLSQRSPARPSSVRSVSSSNVAKTGCCRRPSPASTPEANCPTVSGWPKVSCPINPKDGRDKASLVASFSSFLLYSSNSSSSRRRMVSGNVARHAATLLSGGNHIPNSNIKKGKAI